MNPFEGFRIHLLREKINERNKTKKKKMISKKRAVHACFWQHILIPYCCLCVFWAICQRKTRQRRMNVWRIHDEFPFAYRHGGSTHLNSSSDVNMIWYWNRLCPWLWTSRSQSCPYASFPFWLFLNFSPCLSRFLLAILFVFFSPSLLLNDTFLASGAGHYSGGLHSAHNRHTSLFSRLAAARN